MPTRFEWRTAPDPNDPDLISEGSVIYSKNPRAVAARERRRRLRLKHTRHAPGSGPVCYVCLKPWPCPTPWKQVEVREEFARHGDPRVKDAPPVSADEASAAREFLADWFRDEDSFETPESIEWFGELADFITALPLDDQRVVAATRYVMPLFEDDDDRIEAAIYPVGAAIRFVEEHGWGADFAACFDRFLDKLGRDWATWQAIVARDGADARWSASNPPES